MMYIHGGWILPVTRKYTDEQLLAHPLTKLISSFIRLNQNKEFKTSEIYQGIKKTYGNEIKKYFPGGLNRRTVLDHLNTMFESDLDLIKKSVSNNNTAYWKLKENFSVENYIKEQDKFRIDSCNNQSEIKNFGDYNINIYGFPPDEDFVDFVGDDIKEKWDKRLIESVKKIEKEINKINQINSDRNAFFNSNMLNKFILKKNKITKRFPILDRRILAFLIFQNLTRPFINVFQEKFVYEFLESNHEVIYFQFPGFKKIEINVFEMKSDPLIIVEPHEILIETLKKNYEEYKSKSKEEMYSMLKNYRISDPLTFVFINSTIIQKFRFMIKPLTVVGHFSNISDILISEITVSKVQSECKSLKLNTMEYIEDILDEIFPFDEDITQDYIQDEEKIKRNENKMFSHCPACGAKRDLKKINVNQFLTQYSNDLT